MSDKLRECPNPNCPPHVFIPQVYSDYNEYMNYRRYRVSCGCGTSGPWRENEKDAIAAWNLLPRGPVWTTLTEKDGTLLPHVTGKCLVEAYMKNGPRHRMLAWVSPEGWRDSRAEVWPYHGGDRYMPWPEAQGGG